MAKKSVSAYQRHRERAKVRSAAITAAGQELGAIPPPKDLQRRTRADGDFRYFCETYFHEEFFLAWSADHLRVIEKIERVVMHSETLAVAMPRGDGKTTLCRKAVLWAALTGRHPYIFLISATGDKAIKSLNSIKASLTTNDLLLEDYPEVCLPFRHLEGESRKCVGQRYYGQRTYIEYGKERLVLPMIPGSRAGLAIVESVGISGDIRGPSETRPDGKTMRPTLAIVDDPQTDESAKSYLQTSDRLGLINGAVAGLAGPGQHMGIIIPCTVIQPGDLADQLLDRDENPQWQGERTKMANAWPANDKLWAEYAQVRNDSLRAGGHGREANDLYRQRRQTCGLSLDRERPCKACARQHVCMDAGAVVAWSDRYQHGVELSALQHAWNLRLKYGDVKFFAEYQNDPLVAADDSADVAASAEQVRERFNGRLPGTVPIKCQCLTGMVDVQDRVLYWTVCAWEDDFTGYVLAYGTYPEQHRAHFAQRTAPVPLARRYPAASTEECIRLGLEALLSDLARREWPRDDGAIMRLGLCLVDRGYKPDIVDAAVRRLAQASLLPSRGTGITAADKPFEEYKPQPGQKLGHHWRKPPAHGRDALQRLEFDANYWKTFTHARLRQDLAARGSLTLYGSQAVDHQLFAEHVTAECPVRTEGRGRTVYVLSCPPE
jgi:hypothetical protein